MNIFEEKKFKLLIHIVYSTSGYKSVKEYLQSVDATNKIRIIASAGERK